MPLRPSSLQPLDTESILRHLRRRAKDELQMPAVRADAVTLDMAIVEALQLDSLRTVVLMSRIEEDYGFEFEADGSLMQRLVTVGDLVLAIQNLATTAPEPPCA